MYLKTDAGSVVVADEIVIKRPKSAMEKARKLRAMLEEDVVEPEIIVKRPQSALAKARKRRALLEGDEPVAIVKEKAQDCSDIDLSCSPSSCCGQRKAQDCADVDLSCSRPSSLML